MSNNRSRHFSMTVSTDKLGDISYESKLEFMRRLFKSNGCDYWIFSHEHSEPNESNPDGYDHFQCAFSFRNPRSWKSVIELFKYDNGGYMHVEPSVSPYDAVVYCTKSDTHVDGPYECVNTVFKPKRMYDTHKSQDAVYSAIKNGLSLRRLLENAATRKYVMSHYRVVQDMIGEFQSDYGVDKTAPSHKSCDYIFGASRTGKSSFIKNDEHFTDDVYELNLTGGIRFAFNGYHNESVVLIDDFRDDMIKIDDLLRLLDCYAYRYEVKGGSFRSAYFRKVYITSNIPFDELYEYADDASREALRNRFSNGVIYEKTLDNSIPYDNYSDFVGGVVNRDLIEFPRDLPVSVPVYPDGDMSDYDLMNVLAARVSKSDDLVLTDAYSQLLSLLKKNK